MSSPNHIKTYLIFFSVYAALSLLSFASAFQDGALAYNDISLMYRQEQLQLAFQFPWAHFSNLGNPNLWIGNAFYNLFLIGTSIMAGSVVVGQKILFVMMFAFSGLGFAALIGHFYQSKAAAFVAGLYGIFNFWVFQRVELGHNTLLLGYCMLPFALLLFFKGMDGQRTGSLLLAGVFGALLYLADPHMAYLFYMMIGAYLLIEILPKLKSDFSGTLRRSMSLLLVVGLGLSLSMPFLYLVFTVKEPYYIFSSEEIYNYIANPFLMKISDLPQFIVGLAIIVPILYMILKVRAKKVGEPEKGLTFTLFFLKDRGVKAKNFIYFLFLAIIGIWLSTGLWPLTEVYSWLFNNFIGFVMFREANKFLLFPAISLCFFIGHITDKISEFSKGNLRSFVKDRRLLFYLFLVIGLVLFSGLISNNYGGLVKSVDTPSYQIEYDNWLYSQGQDYRIAIMPPALWDVRYTWADHRFLNPAVALQPKPTVEVRSEQDATLSASFVKWVYTSIYRGKTDAVGKLLGLMGARYVVLRTDAAIPQNRDDFTLFAGNATEIVERAKGLELDRTFGPISVYRVSSDLPMMFPKNDLYLIYGDRRVLIDLAQEDWDFQSGCTLFVDNLKADSIKSVTGVSGLIVEGDRYWDLIISWLGETCTSDTWPEAQISSNGLEGWVRGDLTWYWFDGALNVNPDRYIMTLGQNEITLPVRVEQDGRYLVLIQTWIDSTSIFQGLKVNVSGNPAIEIEPSKVIAGRYAWVPLGYYNLSQNNCTITIKSLGGVGAVSKIAVLPEKSVEAAELGISLYLSSNDIKLMYVLDDQTWTFTNSPMTSVTSIAGASNGILSDLRVSEVHTQIYAPKSDYCKFVARVYGLGEDSVILNIDGNRTLDLETSQLGFTEVISEAVYITEGEHSISLSGKGLVDYLLIVPDEMAFPKERESLSYTAESGSRYEIDSSSNGLVFLETYSPNWLLQSYNSTYVPITAYGFANLYLVGSNSSLSYVLQYYAVPSFITGMLISAIATPSVGLAIMALSKRRHEKTGAVLLLMLVLTTSIPFSYSYIAANSLPQYNTQKDKIVELGILLAPVGFSDSLKSELIDFVDSLPYYTKFNFIIGQWTVLDDVAFVNFLKSRGELIPMFSYEQTYNTSFRESKIDYFFNLFKEKVGYYPKGIFEFQPDTHNVNYASSKYGIKYVAGYCFDQWTLDWMSMRGGWQAPYFSNASNVLIPNKNLGGTVVLPHLTWDWAARYQDHRYDTHLGDANTIFNGWERTTQYCEELIDLTLNELEPFGYVKVAFEFDQLYNNGGLDSARKYYEWLINRNDVLHMTDDEFVDWFAGHYSNTPTYTLSFTSPVAGQQIEWYYSVDYRIARKDGAVVSFIKYQDQMPDKFLSAVAVIDRNNFEWNSSNHIDTSLKFEIDALGGGYLNPPIHDKGIPYSGRLELFPEYYQTIS